MGSDTSSMAEPKEILLQQQLNKTVHAQPSADTLTRLPGYIHVSILPSADKISITTEQSQSDNDIGDMSEQNDTILIFDDSVNVQMLHKTPSVVTAPDPIVSTASIPASAIGIPDMHTNHAAILAPDSRSDLNTLESSISVPDEQISTTDVTT